MRDSGLDNRHGFTANGRHAPANLLTAFLVLIAAALVGILALVPLRAPLDTDANHNPMFTLYRTPRELTADRGLAPAIGRHPAVAAVSRQAGPMPLFVPRPLPPADKLEGQQ